MHVNGKQISLNTPLTINAFLAKEGYDPQKIAVEKNGTIVPKQSFESEMLSENDKLEIVCFVGGG